MHPLNAKYPAAGTIPSGTDVGHVHLKVSSIDKKIHKRVPEGEFSTIVVKLSPTGQTSPEFRYKRKKPKAQ